MRVAIFSVKDVVAVGIAITAAGEPTAADDAATESSTLSVNRSAPAHYTTSEGHLWAACAGRLPADGARVPSNGEWEK